MRKHPSRLSAALVVLGLAGVGIVAAVALAAGGAPPPQATPKTGTPAGTLAIGGVTFAVSSAQFGAGVGVAAPTPGGGPREVSAPSLSEFALTKPNDANSVLLLNKLVARQSFPTATLTLSWDGATWTWELTDVYVSGWSQSTGGGQPSDSFSLNFASVAWKHTAGGVVTEGQYPLP